VQVAAIEIPVNDLLQIRPPETVLPGEMLIICPDEDLKKVRYAAVIIGYLWVPGTINSGRKGHDLSPLRISCRHNIERTFCLSRRI
jgi:hypothetical protein